MKTQLPKYWYLEVTDSNRELINSVRWIPVETSKFITEHLRYDHNEFSFYGYNNFKDIPTSSQPRVEITTEEFKALVLNKPQQLDYEVY